MLQHFAWKSEDVWSITMACAIKKDVIDLIIFRCVFIGCFRIPSLNASCVLPSWQCCWGSMDWNTESMATQTQTQCIMVFVILFFEPSCVHLSSLCHQEPSLLISLSHDEALCLSSLCHQECILMRFLAFFFIEPS